MPYEVSCLSAVFVSRTRVCVFEESTSSIWPTVRGGRGDFRGPRNIHRGEASAEACGKLNSVTSLVFQMRGFGCGVAYPAFGWRGDFIGRR